MKLENEEDNVELDNANGSKFMRIIENYNMPNPLYDDWDSSYSIDNNLNNQQYPKCTLIKNNIKNDSFLNNEFNLSTKNEDVDVDLSYDRSFTTDFLDKELKSKLKENDKINKKTNKKKNKKKNGGGGGTSGKDCDVIQWDDCNVM